MKNQPELKTSNFWFGFALGTITAAGLGYLLGTKSGRLTTQKILEFFDDWEKHLGDWEEKQKTNTQPKILPVSSITGIVEKIRSELHLKKK